MGSQELNDFIELHKKINNGEKANRKVFPHLNYGNNKWSGSYGIIFFLCLGPCPWQDITSFIFR